MHKQENPKPDPETIRQAVADKGAIIKANETVKK